MWMVKTDGPGRIRWYKACRPVVRERKDYICFYLLMRDFFSHFKVDLQGFFVVVLYFLYSYLRQDSNLYKDKREKLWFRGAREVPHSAKAPGNLCIFSP
jgi:hypothetical protein